jgi:hypothetical protein
MGDVVVELETPTDDIFGVVSAALLGGSGQEPAHQLGILHLEVQRDVGDHSEFHRELVQRFG